jgi:predicted metal-dependent hydrolase
VSESPAGTVADIRQFLADLKLELPDIFRPRPQAPPARPELALSSSNGSARTVILERVAYWAERMEASHRRVFIKDQRTLWGSCSARGNLNFNWRLTLTPLEVLDYVVVHELAHLAEPNHSERFWERVARWCPDYKERRRWLRTNGAGLLRRGKPGLNV